jgi:opacity protein-like surface antigen
MKRLLKLSAVALSLAAAAPAAAYDPPGYNWTGLYLGGHVGGGWLNADANLFGDPNTMQQFITGGVGVLDPAPIPSSFDLRDDEFSVDYRLVTINCSTGCSSASRATFRGALKKIQGRRRPTCHS